MEASKLRELRLASPFRPFYLILNDGQRFFVEQSYRLGMAPDGSRLGITTREGVKMIAFEQIKGVDVLPAPIASHG